MFGLIAAVGVRQLSKADLSSNRNLYIAGFALFMGLSVPEYFNSRPGELALESMPNWLGDVVAAAGKTGMAVAAILGILLDNLIPGTAKERGLATNNPLRTPCLCVSPSPIGFHAEAQGGARLAEDGWSGMR